MLEARGLTKVYGRGEDAVRAVGDVDLVVHAGEVVGLLGPNGAGKTMIIKMAAGLVTLTAGRVTIGAAGWPATGTYAFQRAAQLVRRDGTLTRY